jgi:hypothetical protein
MSLINKEKLLEDELLAYASDETPNSWFVIGYNQAISNAKKSINQQPEVTGEAVAWKCVGCGNITGDVIEYLKMCRKAGHESCCHDCKYVPLKPPPDTEATQFENKRLKDDIETYKKMQATDRETIANLQRHIEELKKE